LDKYKLTLTFSDGDVVTETFKTPLGLHRAIKWWKDSQVADQKIGNTEYKIVSFDAVEI
jgi:hypothetical protein